MFFFLAYVASCFFNLTHRICALRYNYFVFLRID
uniref:Uncharacterized protein n=1 Tax=Ascaris lumbricoides TaxID=6252 RepID=A0A0M3HJP0_ASCLU